MNRDYSHCDDCDHFETIGRFTAALASDVTTVALPASEALILPCVARVAAAAVVLTLLTKPPKTAVASMP